MRLPTKVIIAVPLRHLPILMDRLRIQFVTTSQPQNMPISNNASLIAELEAAINGGSQEKHAETLQRVTDLFLGNVDRLNDAQISTFDDVLCLLIKRIETKALAELSARLAPVANAPPEVVRNLARHEEIIVAGPVLTQSGQLTANDLIEIARTKGQPHLLAISGRARLDEAVTDQLLSGGDREVAQKLVENTGAWFSQAGFSTLAKRAATDEGLAKNFSQRLDIPPQVLRELLSLATETVKSCLIVHAPSEVKDEIQNIVASISGEVSREASAPRDFTRAEELISSMRRRIELNEAALLKFANSQKYEEMVAALAALCCASVQSVAALMRSERNDGILITCKAAGLKWATVSAILKNRFAHRAVADAELAQSKADYLVLSQATAERTLGYWKARGHAA